MLRCFRDREDDALEIFHHIVVGKSKYAISAGGEPLIAHLIIADALFEVVTLAINFDDELARMGNEVGDVVAHRTLPASNGKVCL